MNFLKRNLNKFIFVIYVFGILIFPSVIYSAGATPPCVPTDGKICNPLGNTSTLPILIHDVLTKALQVGIPIVALAIIYSGFLFVAARGNSEKLTKAKDTLLYTLIGAAILLGSWGIAMIISSTVLAL